MDLVKKVLKEVFATCKFNEKENRYYITRKHGCEMVETYVILKDFFLRKHYNTSKFVDEI